MLNEALLLEQNKRLREQLEEAQETIRQLRAHSAPDELPPLPTGTPHLTPLEERAFRGLMARPALASREFLYRAMYPVSDDVEIKIVHVMVCRLRRKMPPGYSIETVYGRGWHLAIQSDEAIAA